MPIKSHLLALELILFHRESHLEEVRLLLGVDVLETSRHGRAGVAASVHDVLAVVVLSLVQQSLDTRLREAPGSGVERLFLAPHDGLSVGVHVEVLLELLPREGVELLDAGEGHVIDLVLRAVLVEGRPDLTAAQNHAVNLLGSLDGASLVLGIRDDPLEAGILASKLLNVGPSKRVAEESLGEEDNESCGET